MKDIYFGKEIDLTEHHNNAAIKVNLLDDNSMRKIGFSDLNTENWYFCKSRVGHPDISFALTINKKNKDWKIDILDDNLLQPYDYQFMLESGTNNVTPKKVQQAVEFWMSFLKDNGIIEGHEYGDYI